ncbi:MAG TPA: hypothetical protein VMT55_02960, partial [Candidatus Sulfotelmatobacter sp.]|nr:hypothetical protein [Candidatus Sulfotelmatobacter sp.]
MIKLKFLPLIILLTFGPAAHAWDQININFSQPANTPYFIGQPEINIDAEEFTTLVLKIKAESGGIARLFWATNFDPKMNEPKSLEFTIARSARPKEYVFNLRAQNDYWAGFVGQLLVYPESNPAGIEITAAQAVPGNPVTACQSGWSEFFRYETIKARTVNIIKGPQLNGRSVNFYLYILLLLVFVPALLNGLRQAKKQALLATAQQALYATLVAAIVLAVLLEARLWLDYAKTADLDFNNLWGKTLDEKREITTGGGFYDFLLFCNKVLPE